MEVRYESSRPLDVALTLSQLRHGARDPAFRRTPDGAVWVATLLRSGPVTHRIETIGPGSAVVHLWGDGAAEAAELVPALLGEHDDAAGFAPPEHVREVARRAAGMRMPTTGRVLESLVPAILEQRVQADAAHLSWRQLLWRLGSPAPGPVPDGLRVPPPARTWAAVPSWEWHRAGVDPARARVVVACARLAPRLETAAALPAEEARALWEKVPGIGPWTTAEVSQRSHGDADAVSVGDYNLPRVVGWALARERTDDDGMLRLLAPYAPHRHRLVRLIRRLDFREPSRRGPRTALVDYRRF